MFSLRKTPINFFKPRFISSVNQSKLYNHSALPLSAFFDLSGKIFVNTQNNFKRIAADSFYIQKHLYTDLEAVNPSDSLLCLKSMDKLSAKELALLNGDEHHLFNLFRNSAVSALSTGKASYIEGLVEKFEQLDVANEPVMKMHFSMLRTYLAKANWSKQSPGKIYHQTQLLKELASSEDETIKLNVNYILGDLNFIEGKFFLAKNYYEALMREEGMSSNYLLYNSFANQLALCHFFSGDYENANAVLTEQIKQCKANINSINPFSLGPVINEFILQRGCLELNLTRVLAAQDKSMDEVEESYNEALKSISFGMLSYPSVFGESPEDACKSAISFCQEQLEEKSGLVLKR